MKRYKSKTERRYGENLGIKGERGVSPKAAFRRKPYAPGTQGKNRRARISPFGQQLAEKQKLRIMYGLKEKQFHRYFQKASTSKETTSIALMRLLESRFDNVIYRLGYAQTRSQARQLVVHGHFYLNGRRVNVPSYMVSIGDVIELSPRAKNRAYWKKIPEQVVKYTPPSWLSLDKKNLTAKVVSEMLPEELEAPVNLSLITEYYSR